MIYMGVWLDHQDKFLKRKKHVQNHIKSFHKFESHYYRSHNPNGRYLHHGLKLRKMFNLYELHCKGKKIKAVNKWSCRKKIF